MSMSARTIRVYNILKGRSFSDEEAQEVVDFMETLPKETLATKEDLANLKVELIKWQIGVGVAAGICIVGAMASLFKLYFRA